MLDTFSAIKNSDRINKNCCQSSQVDRQYTQVIKLAEKNISCCKGQVVAIIIK